MLDDEQLREIEEQLAELDGSDSYADKVEIAVERLLDEDTVGFALVTTDRTGRRGHSVRAVDPVCIPADQNLDDVADRLMHVFDERLDHRDG